MKALLALAAAGGLVALKSATGFPCCVFAPADSAEPGSAGSATLACCVPPPAVEDAAVSGQYVEARTAAVYAGACHFSGEYVTAGTEAILAWHVERGVHGGVDLAGQTVVALVRGDENLAEPGPRRAVLYVDAGAPQALVEWARGAYPEVLGEVVRVERAPLSFTRDGDRFEVLAGDDLAVVGSLMPNRECCAMDFNVWYDPFVEVQGRVVGCVDDFACRTQALGRTIRVEGENCAIVGAF
jgi:hypothetical protein